MAIIKQYHKDTDTTYVYESVSYWDAEKQQSRSKRRVIGKLDPETGEIIPTGKRGRKKDSAREASAGPAKNSLSQGAAGELQSQIRLQQIEISTLKGRVSSLEEENRRLRASLSKAGALAGKIGDICSASDGGI